MQILAGGFGGQGAGKGDAKIQQAMGNLGQGSVFGVWSYQGSKPFVSKGCLYNAMGDTLQAVDATTAKVTWKKTFATKEGKEKDQKLSGKSDEQTAQWNPYLVPEIRAHD